MAKEKQKSKAKRVAGEKFVTVSSKSYGNALKGIRVYYEGKKPKALKKDGSIQFGKHVLEVLKRRFFAAGDLMPSMFFNFLILSAMRRNSGSRCITQVRTSSTTPTGVD